LQRLAHAVYAVNVAIARLRPVVITPGGYVGQARVRRERRGALPRWRGRGEQSDMINQTLPCAHALRRAVALVCQAPRPSRTKDQRLGAFSGVASRSGPSDPRALLVALARSGASPYHGFPPRPRQRGSAPGLRLLTNHFSPIRRALCLLRAGFSFGCDT
jgi:hypothetical protein